MVLLFWLEMWVMTLRMGRDLAIFQNRVARQLTERHPRRFWVKSWEYPPFEEAIKEEMWDVGLVVVEANILKMNNMVMGTGEVRLGRGGGGCDNRGGGGTI